jgi:hypothetical protein
MSASPDLLCLDWPHGQAELQALGAMLAPVVFRRAGHPDFAPFQVAPWADEQHDPPLTGLISRLRGEWPCVPFGRTDRPADLPEGWLPRTPHDPWGHGYASHHAWRLSGPGPGLLEATLTLPEADPVRRLSRHLAADAMAPALDLRLEIEARCATVLPVALHPTLRLDLGRVHLQVAHRGPGCVYPVAAEPSSRLQADARFASLQAVPLREGGTLDLSRFPLAADSEELLQLRDIDGPVHLHYLDAGWTLQLDWDRAMLPDLMLWVSHRGRPQAPWNGRHLALGVEPVCGVFDLGRVAQPPADHPLADRTGLALSPDTPVTLRYRFEAWPLAGAHP